MGIDSAMFRIIGDGRNPPILRSHASNKALRTVTLDRVTEMLFESELEQPLRCVRGKGEREWGGMEDPRNNIPRGAE